MKNRVLVVVLVSAFYLSAQTKGKITYKLELLKDSLEQPYENPNNTDVQNEALEIMHESSPVQATLLFNESVSLYYVEGEQNAPNWNMTDEVISITPSGINFTWFMAGGETLYYVDWARDYMITQNNILGKPKRIIAQPKTWILTDETKEIDGYLCQLAIIEKLNNKKTKAWYAKEIPVKHGPRNFNGLPGLIIKVEDVKYIWTIVEYDFESKDADDIVEPTKGKLITQEEFRRLAGNPFGN
jgi:GLPGLI family protein